MTYLGDQKAQQIVARRRRWELARRAGADLCTGIALAGMGHVGSRFYEAGDTVGLWASVGVAAFITFSYWLRASWR